VDATARIAVSFLDMRRPTLRKSMYFVAAAGGAPLATIKWYVGQPRRY
jgi:hypothetical protein